MVVVLCSADCRRYPHKEREVPEQSRDPPAGKEQVDRREEAEGPGDPDGALLKDCGSRTRGIARRRM
jgi:hypothetical protein